ncbi:MAG: bile acid:sodium symporter [Sphingomonadales bacterium]|nr:MAG: bile acid:sodium symporter [Sphingomonadales bacterium]
MYASISRIFDPMIQLLLVALALAVFAPLHEDQQELGQWIANAAVFVLFLINGLRLSRTQVRKGITDWQFHGALVLWVFGAMLLGAWGLWHIGGYFMPPLLALGFLYLGALPSTVQSATVYTSMAGGNVAHAVVAAALLNVLGVFISAPLFAILAGSSAVAFHGEVLIKIAVILLLPFAIGQILQPRLGRLVTDNPRLTRWTDRVPIALAVYVAMSAAVNEGIWTRIDASAWSIALVTVVAYLVYAILGSWSAGGLLSLSREDRIAFLFGGTQKSLAMGAPLATILFDPAAAGIILIPLITYHFMQLVVAAPIANQLVRSGQAISSPND